jgi:Ca2+-binding RTX toxin-like protein
MFELDALEQRILLSAEGCAAAASGLPSASDPLTAVENVSADEPITPAMGSKLVYNPADEVDQMFSHVDSDSASSGTPAAASSSDPATPDSSQDNASTDVTDSHSSDAASEAQPASNSEPVTGDDPQALGATSTEISNPLTDQLTDTLKAGNAPPADGGIHLHLSPEEVLDPNQDLVLNPGDSLSGSGAVPGGLVNNGHLSPGNSPGVITIENSFTQGPEGTTTIEIGGTAGPGVNPNGHDQINVTGDINLDGTVQIELFNGFIPSAGQSFVIIHWTGTRTGAIANWLGTTGIPGHNELAFDPVYDNVAKTLTLNVVTTPTIVPVVGTTIQDGLDKLQQVGNALDGIGEMAESLPLVGDSVGNLVNVGQGINDVIRNQLMTLLGSVPRQSDVTNEIESWDGTTVGGFQIKVKGVLGHYGASMSWDVNIELTQLYLNQALNDLTGALLGALFNPDPQVDIRGTLEFNFAFGYDSGFFVKVNDLTARVTVDAMHNGGLAFDFLDAPGGLAHLDVTNWSVNFEAHVTATPDSSILDPQGRILFGTLEQILGLAAPAINPADAFNLDEGGTVDASFTLVGGFGLMGAANYSGTHTVRIQSSDVFSGSDPDLTVVIVGDLQVLGQTLSGTFTLKKTVAETVVEMANGVLDLNAGPVRILRAENGTGKFVLLDGDLAGSASLTIAEGPALPNIDISGTTLNLRFNTSTDPVPTIDGETVNLPGGEFYRLAGNALIHLDVPQVSLTGDFVFEPRDADMNTANGYEQVAVGVANLNFQFDDGVVALVNVGNGSGAFLFTDEGILGWAMASVSVLVPGINLTGTFSLTLNDTSSYFGSLPLDVNGTMVTIPALPAGPYVRVTGEDAELEILGISLSGDFTLEQKETTTGGEKVVTVGFANVAFPLGTLTANLLNVSSLSGAFIITNDGVAGMGSGAVTLNVPGVILTGAFSVRVNTTDADVNEMVDVLGTVIPINTPAGPYLQVNGTGVMLSVLGVGLTGDFSFEQRVSEEGAQLVTLVADNVNFNFGTSLVTLTNGHALFLLTENGMAGKGMITAGINAFGMGFSHTFDWSFNNTNGPIDQSVDWEGTIESIHLPTGPFNRLDSGGPVTLAVNVAGQTQSITAELVLTLVDDPGGDFVTIGASSLETTLGAGPLSLQVTGGTGAFVLKSAGLAGVVTVDDATLSGASAISLSASNLRLELNNTGTDVDQMVSVSEDAADDVHIHFAGAYYHYYLAVAGVADLTVGTFVTLTGTFRFERSDSNPNAFKVSGEGMMFDLKAGTFSVVSFSHGTGAFLVTSDGIAGVADLDFEVGLIGISGDISLEVNSTNAAVNTTVTTASGMTTINLTRVNYLSVSVSGHLEVGSFSLPFDFTVEASGGNVEFRTQPPDNQVLVTIDSMGHISLGPALMGLTDLDFSRPDPFEFVSMLRQLLNWLQIFRESDLFNVKIPFTSGTTLGDAFDWSGVFLDKIYSYMESVELQSSLIFASTVNTGPLSGAKLKIQIGGETPVELTVTDTIGSANSRDGTELVTLFTNAINASTLMGRLEARLNKDNRLVLALAPAEIAQGNSLNLVDLDTKIQGLGFGPSDGNYGDMNDTTAEQVGLETERYSTEDFIVVLADLLNDDTINGNGGVTYDPAQRVYTYTVDKSAPFSLDVPFDFGVDLGDLAGADLSGELNLSGEVGFSFTLGFDLGAQEVPRILSSSLVPVPSNGKISENAHFEIYLNNDPTPQFLTLNKSATNDNDSIDKLAVDFNNLFAATTYNGQPGNPFNGMKLDQLLYAQKAGSLLAISVLNEDLNGNGAFDPMEDLNGDMNFDNQLGAINQLTIRSRQNDVFATELGFGIEALDDGGVSYFQSTSTSTIKGLFVDDINLHASLGVTTPTLIHGSVRLGFVEISTTGGSVETPTDLTANVSITNQDTGDTRLYINELMSSLSSINVGHMIQGPDFEGSFSLTLPNITVGGLGFSVPLGGDPEVSVFIPDINDLNFNSAPYDGTNTGIFLTYPDLGHLMNLSSLSFTQIIQALNVVADNLSQLSAFSFLDEPLPIINVSINDLVDYATRFAELIDAAASGNSQSLQETLGNLETQIEELFDLDPSILTVSLDTNDTMTAGAVNGVSPAAATVNPGGYNNGITFTSTANNTSFNGVLIRYVSDPELTGDTATVTWNATSKVLTIQVNGGVTTANTVVDEVNALAGTPWHATLVASDNPMAGNTGGGTFPTTALKFSFNFTTGYADSLPFQLDLKDLVTQLAGQNASVAAFLDAVTDFIQAQGSGVLTVSASAALTLDFGLDLTVPSTVKPFFYDTTGVVLNGKVLGTNLEFSATIGAVAGIKIKGGAVTIDKDGNPLTNAGTGDRGAEFRLGLRDNNGDGRHYFDENWLDFDNIDLHMEGGVSAMLPIFIVVGSGELPLGSDADTNGDGYPDNQLVIDIPDLVRFFVDTSAQRLTREIPMSMGMTETVDVARLRLPGQNNDIEIVRHLLDHPNFEVVLQQAGSVGASFNNDILTIQIVSGVTTAQQVKTAVENLMMGFEVNALTPDNTQPMPGNTLLGTVTTSKLALVTPDLSSLFADLDFCDLLNQNAGLFLDGLDALLGTIQDGLEAVAFSVRLPLIGDGFAGAANFIDDFRNGLLSDLRNEIKEAGSATAAIENAIKKVFWNLLGPPGLNILVNPANGNPLDVAAGYQQLDVTLSCDDGLKVNLRLKKEAALIDTSSNPIAFDIGVPGFGLKVDGNVKLAVGFDLKFGFGFNAEDGFYFDSSAPASNPELRIYIEATIPGLTATGTLLFLQLQVADKADDPSHFTGQFVVDLMDPNHDGKLTFAEMTSSGTHFKDIIHADLEAVADINLDLSASFGGNTAFPRILAEFHLDWMWSLQNGSGHPTVAFTNIYLDLGTFLSDFLGPILSKIQEVTEPVQPIIDVVTARLPILSDLAGKKITLLDLAEVFGLLEPSTVDFISDVLAVVSLINKLEGLGEGSILIPFGAFSLGSDSAGNMNQIQVLQNVAQMTTAEVQNAIMMSNTGASETFKSQSAGFVGDVGSLNNFSIPVFDNPSELFNLFTGGTVRLIEWRMPQFKFEFTYIQKIPIYPPLYAQFGGRIGATIDVGFGYDTFGIQKFISSEDKNPIDILDGFYVIDFDANGNDRPELTLTGELFAGASIDLGIIEVGVRGGVFATIEFDLNDVNNDGKVRVSEIIALAEIDPRCIFNIHGEIGLFLEAFLKVDLFFFSIDKTWRFAEITLFSFDLTCPEPVLATPSGNDLLLNIGSRAGDRQEIDTSDGSERFIVKHVSGTAGGETVEVQWGNYKKEFTFSGSIIVQDAGEGDDYLDFRGVLSPVNIMTAGAGNDTIYLSDGTGSVAHGGKGNDTIIASSADTATMVKIYGDEGNDTLTAGAVAIEIHGGAGNDVITGSPESDNAMLPGGFGGLYGDEGNDTINALDGDDYADGGAGNDTIDGGAGNDWLLGGSGNDMLYGRRGDDILEGNGGDDTLLGSSGNDLLIGGLGDDYLNGHAGIDVLIGDNYGSVKINGMTVGQTNIGDLMPLIAQMGLSVLGISGDGDNNTANDGDDLLVGGGNVDVLFGGEGDDYLYGGNLFNNGESGVIEEDGNDFFDGGPGNDVIFGDDAMGRTGDRNTGIAIKSSIFFDSNENGRRDDKETGFGGVTVKLYLVGGIPVTSTTTESDGSFEFLGLDPGDYYLAFPNVPPGMDFTLQSAPATMGGTPASKPDDDPLDSDPDTTTGETQLFHVDFNETESAVAAGFKGAAKVSVANASVSEGNVGQTSLVFTVTLSHFQGDPVEIDYQTMDLPGPMGASMANGDYDFLSGTLVFNPGELSKTISVLVNGDTTYEEHQQFQLQITRAQRMEATPVDLQVTNPQILGTIINDDPIPQIAIADYVPPSTVTEDGTKVYLVGEGQDATFVISLSNASQYPIKVYYRSDAAYGYNGLPVEGAATPNGLGGTPDFELLTDKLVVFQPGEVRKQVTVPVYDETELGLAPLDEPDEEFFVDIYNPENARISDARGYGIIPDDDAPVSASIALLGMPTVFTTSVMEGNASSVFVDLEVRLSAPSGKTVTVTYATAPGTAVESVYSGDSSNSPDYVGLPNDTTPDDLTTLVFEPGVMSRRIRVEILPDNRVEPNEMFFVNILSADNADIAANVPNESNHVTIEIQNDDTTPGGVDLGPWSIRFSGITYTVQEPDTGDTTAAITIIRNAGSTASVAVFYTEDGSAKSTGPDPDYDSVFRQLVVFGEGEYSKTVYVTVHSDDAAEGNETVHLFLRAPTGQPTTAFPNQATLVIKDDDVPSLLVLAPPIFGTGLTEGSSGGTSPYDFIIIPVDKDGNFVVPTYDIHFDYEFVSLTARNGKDFFGTNSSGVIAANSSYTTVSFDLKEDTLPELTEKFALRLTHSADAILEQQYRVGVVTIFDDDPLPVKGKVFYDSNGNGFKDATENGIKDVSVKVTYVQNGVEQTTTVMTNASGDYQANVFLGQVSIMVDGETVTSPWQGLGVILFGSGNYETTTANENQTTTFDGVVGISPFTPVGYKNSFRFSFPASTDDVGRGGTDDTIFGGPGNDVIDAGAGDDHVVGGHWMTATDGNLPVNTGNYDAVIHAVTDPNNPDNNDPSSPPLHNVYDQGPIFEVDVSNLGPTGTISGQIWFDANDNGVQEGSDPLFTLAAYGQDVVVNLFDNTGNWVDSLFTNTGTYAFTLLLKTDGTASNYVVQFELPKDFKYAKESPGLTNPTRDNDGFLGGRTQVISLKKATGADPTANVAADIDLGLRPSDLMPTSGSGKFEFDDPSYSVNENVASGVVTVVVVRGNSTQSRAVIVRTVDGDAKAGINYVAFSGLLNFEVGETFKTIDIPIIDTNTLGFSDVLYFTLVLRDPTGRPLDQTTVYIFGDGAGKIMDDDTIQGGDDWDLILADSGSIPAASVIADPLSLDMIRTAGGPGKDVVFGGNGPDWINGQLGNDRLAGNAGRDIVLGGLGDDVIIVERSDDVTVGETVDGGHGFDTVISDKDVSLIQLISTGATTADLYHKDSSGAAVGLFKLTDIEMAQLYGGFQANTFDIQQWSGSAFIVGREGNDTLLVTNDFDSMILKNATPLEKILFFLVYGFSKDAAISLPNDSTYHLSSLENVVLTGGPSANKLDASGYSRPVTLVGMGGDDELIGGSADDTFVFDADAVLGTDKVKGNGGHDTLFFGSITLGEVHYETLANVTVNLSLFDDTMPPSQPVVVSGNLHLQLRDAIENVTGGSGDDNLTGNDLDNVLNGGPGNDMLAGGVGNERYVYDTDLAMGLEMETITEFMSDAGLDVIDFSGITTQSVTLNLSILNAYQDVTPFLQLKIVGEGVEEVRGGSRDDVLRGNSNNNILRGGLGNDILDGKSGNDLLDGGPGNDDLNGGPGLDAINETANTNFILTNHSLSRSTGEFDTLDNIEVANLAGGTSANTFTLTGWTGSGNVRGLGGVDTVILAADANFTLSDSMLSASPGLSMGLNSIENAILTGGAGANTFNASAFSGNVRLNGQEGDDTFLGGPGSENIQGGTGTDTYIRDLTALGFAATVSLQNNGILVLWQPPMMPQLADLDLLAGVENVQLTATPNNDTIDVSGWTAGNITLDGGGGSDILQATVAGAVTLTDTAISFTGSSGSITFSMIEAAILTGSDGDDIMNALTFSGQVWLKGGKGNDVLVGAKGNDILDGGEGDDVFVLAEDGVLDQDVIIGGDGNDTLNFGGHMSLGIPAFSAGVTIDLSITLSYQPVAPDLQIGFISEDLENVIGGAGDDHLTGNASDNTFTGGLGADTIDGVGGLNTLVESADADFLLTDLSLLSGGVMDNLMNIQVADLTGGAGINTLDASGFSGQTTLRGGAGDDILIGGTGGNRLIGGAGDDTLRGNTGSDTYEFDVDELLGQDTVDDLGGIDLFDFSPTHDVGVNVNLSATGGQQVVHATNLLLTITNTTEIDYIIGGAKADLLTGNNADNAFWGQGGDDVIDGRAGTNFIFEMRDANMVLTNMDLTIQGVDENGTAYTEKDTLANIQMAILQGGAGNNTLDASAFTLGTVTLQGEAGDDTLIGGSGNDFLRGGEGNDFLFGGAGNDDLQGEDGNDTLNGGAEDSVVPMGDDDILEGGNGNDTYVFDLALNDIYGTPLNLGADTIVEQDQNSGFYPMAGYHDVIMGVGLAGLDVDLFDATPQKFFYVDNANVSHLVLTLTLTPGTIEDAF